jgi:hypothetical protein
MPTFSSSAVRTTIPRQLEITRSFEVQDTDEAELKARRDRIFNADLEADLRAILGRSVEQLSFGEVTWARFGEFVQRIRVLAADVEQQDGPVEKSELVTRLRLQAGK